MTNYEAFYNQAMAHVAMLREGIREVWLNTAPCVQGTYKKRELETLVKRINEILTPIHGVTGPDVEAWERNLREQVMLAVHPLQPEYEKLQQQLATVTAERDAELVAENERIGGLAEEWAGKYHALQAENERLKEMINANPAQA